ncbi:MAG: LysM peptidoglycan-binding domain-containing protein [Patescibacteria group bacterium]|nr:LysM peptidoglycan-binding domain-containing protein [Patescibacteria group bacterium]
MPRKKISNIASGPINTNSKLASFGQFKWGESYTSLILGLIVVVIASILIVSFAKNLSRKNIVPTQQTLSQKTEEIKTDNNGENKIVSGENVYTIVAGDDLWNISQKFYKTGYKWTEIAKANNIENPDVITAGSKLKLPKIAVASQEVTGEAKADTVSKTENPTSIKGETYTIQKGDYLWDIAVRAYGDGYKWTDIAKVNNYTEPNLIFSGNILKIPR